MLNIQGGRNVWEVLVLRCFTIACTCIAAKEPKSLIPYACSLWLWYYQNVICRAVSVCVTECLSSSPDQPVLISRRHSCVTLSVIKPPRSLSYDLWTCPLTHTSRWQGWLSLDMCLKYRKDIGSGFCRCTDRMSQMLARDFNVLHRKQTLANRRPVFTEIRWFKVYVVGAALPDDSVSEEHYSISARVDLYKHHRAGNINLTLFAGMATRSSSADVQLPINPPPKPSGRYAHCPEYDTRVSRRMGGAIVGLAALAVVLGVAGFAIQFSRDDDDDMNPGELSAAGVWCGAFVSIRHSTLLSKMWTYHVTPAVGGGGGWWWWWSRRRRRSYSSIVCSYLRRCTVWVCVQ